MTEPQRLVKDSVLSIVTVDNFAENLVPGRDFLISLSPAADQEWWLDFETNTIDGIEYLALHIKMAGFPSWKYFTSIGISLMNDNSIDTVMGTLTDDYFINDSWGFPQFIELSEVLAENSGFLRNGALTVQCEVRVDVITDRHGIRRFNFHDPFEGCVRFKERDGERTFYAIKGMVMFHCPILAEKIAAGEEEFTFSDYSREDFEWYLQLIHGLGVGHLPNWSLGEILVYSVLFGTFDVIQRYHLLPKLMIGLPDKFNMMFFSRLLKKTKRMRLEELKKVVEYQGERLDTEMMKRVTRKFFSFAVDSRVLKKLKK